MSVELTWSIPTIPGAEERRPGEYKASSARPSGTLAAMCRHRRDRGRCARSRFWADRGQHVRDPVSSRPIEWGADIVLHSATKFIGGHGTSIGGGGGLGQFNWSNGRFPVIAEPSAAYTDSSSTKTFGTYGYLMKLRVETLRDLACMSPFNAFVSAGTETLSLWMSRHVENAEAVAVISRLTNWPERDLSRPGASRHRPAADGIRRGARGRCSPSTAGAAAPRDRVHSR